MNDREVRAQSTLRAQSDRELMMLLAHALDGRFIFPGIFDEATAVRLIREEQARRSG